MTSANITMVGGVSAGKTTFLVAFWNILSDLRKPHAVTFEAMPDVRDRLNALQEIWLKCAQLPRTPITDLNNNEIGLVSIRGKTPISLRIPDRAGESFDNQWAQREVTADYASSVEEQGILLFINPEILVAPRHINATLNELAELGGVEMEDDESPRGRRAGDAPTQVVLVDCLHL